MDEAVDTTWWTSPKPQDPNRDVVSDLEEYTFHAPRVGLFVGDSPTYPLSFRESTISTIHEEEGEELPVSGASRDVVMISILPQEVWGHIFDNLDVVSLNNFKRANRHANLLVECTPEYHFVNTFPGLPKALRLLELLETHSFGEIRRVLRDSKCSLCKNLGDYLQLLAFKRRCHDCWSKKPGSDIKLAPSKMATRDLEALKSTVPHVLVSPGVYGHSIKGEILAPRVGFDYSALQALPNPPDWTPLHIREQGDVNCARYCAVIRAPHLDEHTKSIEEGFFCRACAFREIARSRWCLGTFLSWGPPWIRYTREGMRKHIEQQGRIIRTYSSEGTGYRHEREPEVSCEWDYDVIDMYYGLWGIWERCRDKEIEFPQLQPYVDDWFRVKWNKVFPVTILPVGEEV